MIFQEIVDSIRVLSVREQDSLIELIHQQRKQQRGNDLWSDLQKFRNTLEQEKIFYDEDDFSNLRERTSGREVNLST
ncbi:hypothetical protein [Chamaesiphon polymorphus]|uniref:DUF2281 domain-containing protein n=1 Tax=Chamaesiphon polymorphus CCALA 037 TaxID=2107692 RepID=A0A2T1GKD6_9CYAN|nr:hypothetical protein [Chamaesiphon polymorphus]PSB58305.1 hypothetical protein C7B77_05200 [Chamaesiphon polymorphus CCALA 037]